MRSRVLPDGSQEGEATLAQGDTTTGHENQGVMTQNHLVKT
jgi:hypothetical protein